MFSITLDNASNNNLFVEMLKCRLNMINSLLCGGEHFHIHCCAHILNRIVQDGLKEINEVVTKIVKV